MPKMHSIKRVDDDVMTAARRRINELFDRFDCMMVSFSGGKDSTVVLNLCLEVAHERKRLPLDVMFMDEECCTPETIEYVERVAARPDVRLKWSCVPLKHRNACSRRQPYWLTWNPAEKHLWLREMPAVAITAESRPDIPWGTIVGQAGYLYPPSLGTVCGVVGRRTQESLTRLRMILGRTGEQAYIGTVALSQDDGSGDAIAWHHMRAADPIYDFSSEDVWLAIMANGWDYNRTYDVYSKMGIASPLAQRVAPPFGDEPSRSLWLWQVGWPDLWAKMSKRVHGVNTCIRYSQTPLYGARGGTRDEKQDYKALTDTAIMKWEPKARATLCANIRLVMQLHRQRCLAKLGRIEPIPNETPHPASSVNWRDIHRIASRGVLKSRSIAQRFNMYDTQKKPKRKK